MFREIFQGMAQRIKLENSLQLQKQKLIRPKQVRLEVAQVYRGIQTELAGDPELTKIYNEINIVVEGETAPTPVVRQVA
jgi:hypothetical protein